jgi:hypothetical protein
VEAFVTDGLATEALQEGASPPATPGPFDPDGDDHPPKDIAANGHDLSVDEHYEIARMTREEVRRRYVVRHVDEFIARVKAAIRYWDGVPF